MGGFAYGCTPSPEPVAMASPWLSAVPRAGMGEGNRLAPMRRAVGVGLGIRGVDVGMGVGVEHRREGAEGESAYDADSDGSCGAAPRAKRRMGSRDFEGRRGSRGVVAGEGRGLKEDAEKSAALMLMSLSVGDGREMHDLKRKRPASL